MQLVIRLFLVVFSTAISFAVQSAPSVHGMQRQVLLQQHVNRFLNSSDFASSESFIRQLVGIARNDREKAWLIYRWVTGRFVHDSGASTRRGRLAERSLGDLMKQGRGGCETFSHVLNSMFKLAGLDSRVVVGHANQPGGQRASRWVQRNHAWNSVFIDGQWRVVDATWGAGYVDESGFIRDQTDLFFLLPQETAELLYFEVPSTPSEPVHAEWTGTSLDAASFGNLSPGAAYAAFVGFDQQELIKASQAGQPIVDTFDLPNGSFSVQDAPVHRNLRKGARRFSVRSSVYESLAVVQGKRWTTLQKSGELFSGNVQLQFGELLIMGRMRGQTEYEALLGYQVR